MAAIVKDIDMAAVTQKVLNTGEADSLLNGGTNIIPGAGYIEVPKLGTFNYADIQDFVKNIFVDHYITDENARVEVQNGSGVAGTASTVVKSLKAAHYYVGDATNAASHYTKTVIYDYTGGKKPYTINYLEQRFGVKAQKMPSPTPSLDASGRPGATPEIRIILGSDYKSTAVDKPSRGRMPCRVGAGPYGVWLVSAQRLVAICFGAAGGGRSVVVADVFAQKGWEVWK
jgi:hypothetical protein